MKIKRSSLKEKKAKGKKGVLIRQLDGEIVFRIYNKDKSFKDYEIWHNDLEVEITDDMASFWENKKHFILDHDSKTLGIKKKS